MRKLSFLLLFLSLTFNLYAQEAITGFEDKDLPVLNEELRKTIKTSDVGTAASQVLQLNSSGLVPTGNLGSGTASSSTYLRGDSTWAAINLAFSNVIFSWTGQTEVSAATRGMYSGTSLTPDGITGNYFFLQSSISGGETLLRSKFVKIAGISTVTVWCNIWCEGGGVAAKGIAAIGAVSGSVTGTVGQTTPEWKSFTLDVSGLTNGTTYELTAGIGSNSSGSEGYMGSIIMIGS